MIFQQDRANLHHATKVRNYLNEKLEHAWIGRRGTTEWPARSPDLTPLDFFFWGVMKDRVYSKKFSDLDELKKAIKKEALALAKDTDLLNKVCYSIADRIHECIEADGGNFEQNH